MVGSSPDRHDLIDLTGLSWLEATMCACLGAVLHKQTMRGKTLAIAGLSGKPEAILRKNGFLTHFGHDRIRDTYETTIQYGQFQRKDREAFQRYISHHFRPGSRGLPEMSMALLRRFRESLFEIYWNAVEHSETELGIFACGQYFPRRNRLSLSIVDLGVGIRERIFRDLGTRMNPGEAINWAMSGNTSRKGRRPGGLGLMLIRELVNLNDGRIVVVSDSGYWKLAKGSVKQKYFDRPFLGTVVTVEINTADETSYRLKNEVDPAAIF
jgi:hypothetical protein